MFTNHKMANTVPLTSVTLSVDECELTDYGNLIVFQNVLSEAVLRICKSDSFNSGYSTIIATKLRFFLFFFSK